MHFFKKLFLNSLSILMLININLQSLRSITIDLKEYVLMSFRLQQKRLLWQLNFSCKRLVREYIYI